MIMIVATVTSFIDNFVHSNYCRRYVLYYNHDILHIFFAKTKTKYYCYYVWWLVHLSSTRTRPCLGYIWKLDPCRTQPSCIDSNTFAITVCKLRKLSWDCNWFCWFVLDLTYSCGECTTTCNGDREYLSMTHVQRTLPGWGIRTPSTRQLTTNSYYA